jgi:hypothetical protein
LFSDTDVPTTSSHKQFAMLYWSTDPTITTPIFAHTMSRDHLEFIWPPWHFIDCSKETQDSGRLFKMWPGYECFVQKFRSVYMPKQETSLDETIISMCGAWNLGQKSRESNKIRRAGENFVWGIIGFYLQHGDVLIWGKEIWGQSYHFSSEAKARIISIKKIFITEIRWNIARQKCGSLLHYEG